MTQRLCVCQLTNYAKLPADTSTSKNPVIYFFTSGVSGKVLNVLPQIFLHKCDGV